MLICSQDPCQEKKKTKTKTDLWLFQSQSQAVTPRQGIETISRFNCFLSDFQIIFILALVLSRLQFQRTRIANPCALLNSISLSWMVLGVCRRLSTRSLRCAGSVTALCHTLHVPGFPCSWLLLTSLVNLGLKYLFTAVSGRGQMHVCSILAQRIILLYVFCILISYMLQISQFVAFSPFMVSLMNRSS